MSEEKNERRKSSSSFNQYHKLLIFKFPFSNDVSGIVFETHEILNVGNGYTYIYIWSVRLLSGL